MVRSRVLLSAVVAGLAVTLAGCDQTAVYPGSVMASVTAVRFMREGITARLIMAAATMAAEAIMEAGMAGGAGSTGVPAITTAGTAAIVAATAVVASTAAGSMAGASTEEGSMAVAATAAHSGVRAIGRT